MAITLIYERNGTQYSEEFPTLIVRGMDEPDTLRKLCIVHNYLDGSIVEQVRGYNKVITLTFRPSITAAQRRFLANWFVAADKAVLYTTADDLQYISTGIIENELVAEWLKACELDRIFTVQFLDTRCYSAWVDPATPTAEEDLMYMKLSVEMNDTKTEADPEIFTTNVDKLLVDEWGNSFPTFSAATHKFFVIMKSADGCSADFPIANIHITAGNLVFETFPASGFIPAPDGKLYANFAVWLQAKPT